MSLLLSLFLSIFFLSLSCTRTRSFSVSSSYALTYLLKLLLQDTAWYTCKLYILATSCILFYSFSRYGATTHSLSACLLSFRWAYAFSLFFLCTHSNSLFPYSFRHYVHLYSIPISVLLHELFPYISILPTFILRLFFNAQ